jgi:hypothetical protein
MTNRYSSSKLRVFNNNCPRAMQLYEQRVDFDRDIFAAGTCAHVIMQHLGMHNVAADDTAAIEQTGEAVARALISNGRRFEDSAEPPLQPEAAFAGRDIALSYAVANWYPIPDAIYEIGLGMSANGEACAWNDPACRFGGWLDMVYHELHGDEEYAADAVVVRDWKTQWHTDDSSLDTLQMRGYAVLISKHKPDMQTIILEVVNLRTWQTHRRVLQLDDETRAMLAQWERDILATCDAADSMRGMHDGMPARVGAGCAACHYVTQCDACLAAYASDATSDAAKLASTEAVRKALMPILKVKTQDSAPIQIPGGYVGFRKREKRVVADSAPRCILEHWYIDDAETHDLEAGLLTACNLGITNVLKVIKQIYPGKENSAARVDMEQRCLTTTTAAEFGVHKGA